MAKRKRKRMPKRAQTRRNRSRTVRKGEQRQATVTPENRQSSGISRTKRESEVQQPQYRWMAVEHRDADGNPTLPRDLIVSTYGRRYEAVPEGTEIKAHVLAGYKPRALMLVERKIYEIHRQSVQGWRRRGQIVVEMDGWREHEADWFNAMQGAELVVSDPALPRLHSEEARYTISASSFDRKIVKSVDESGSQTEVQMCEGTLDIVETWRSAWQRQRREVLSGGFKYFLLPTLSALIGGLIVWSIVRSPSSDGHDPANPESSAEDRVQESMSDSIGEPSDLATKHPSTKILPKPTETEKRDSTVSTLVGESTAERSMADSKQERKQGVGTNPSTPGLEEHTPENRGSLSRN